jgi:hypothetical protein
VGGRVLRQTPASLVTQARPRRPSTQTSPTRCEGKRNGIGTRALAVQDQLSTAPASTFADRPTPFRDTEPRSYGKLQPDLDCLRHSFRRQAQVSPTLTFAIDDHNLNRASVVKRLEDGIDERDRLLDLRVLA